MSANIMRMWDQARRRCDQDVPAALQSVAGWLLHQAAVETAITRVAELEQGFTFYIQQHNYSRRGHRYRQYKIGEQGLPHVGRPSLEVPAQLGSHLLNVLDAVTACELDVKCVYDTLNYAGIKSY